MDQTIELEIINPVYVKVLKGLPVVREMLSYKDISFRKGKFKKEQVSVKKTFVTGNCFPFGFLDRVYDECKKMNLGLTTHGVQEKLETGNPEIRGIQFRTDQKQFINTALDYQRGVLLAFTGSGKTILLAGMLQSLKGHTVAVLADKAGLITQTTSELRKFGFDVKNKWEESDAPIICCTRSYMARNCDRPEWTEIDAVIVDECHIGFAKINKRVGPNKYSDEGEYEKMLKTTLAPFRIGLTATLPNDEKSKLNLEGLLGPVIAELTHEEGTQKNLSETPTIKLIPIQNYPHINNFLYPHIYKKCIVENYSRNKIIITVANKLVEEGHSVLIYAKAIDHIDALADIAEDVGLRYVIADGITDTEDREKIRKAMIEGTVRCCISSVVFREGINIPNLNALIMAGGGKSEAGTIQVIGRILRKHPEKKEAIVVDFIDNAKYLSEHFCARLSLYTQKGWIK